MKEQIQSGLNALGFTAYEAKAYTALIETGGGSGYLIAKKSAVPSSKIYQVLDSLVKKHVAYQDSLSENAFFPIMPETMLARLKNDTVHQADQVLEMIKQYCPETKEVQARMHTGTEQVRRVIKDFIAATQTSIMLTAWADDLEAHREEIEQCSAKRRVIILSIKDFQMSNAELYVHRRPDLVCKESPGRIFLGVADDNSCISAVLYADNHAECIISSSPGFVRIIKDHIIHDISLNKLMAELPGKYRESFEKELTALRNSFQ
jgi:HTH-type transcriptional regulator, sugar sensing transcriptional regulator